MVAEWSRGLGVKCTSMATLGEHPPRKGVHSSEIERVVFASGTDADGVQL